MFKIKMFAALLILLALGYGAHRFETSNLKAQNDVLVQQLNQKNQVLHQTELDLKKVKHLLDVSDQKLGYLATHKTVVQVTAFCKQPNSNHFANGHSVHTAFAVKKNTLPEDTVVNIALSPVTQRRLNAKMGDLIVIMDCKGKRKTLARFVDTTFTGETRPVIDVYFADPYNARHWGRKTGYFAVNISGRESPFRLN